MPNLPTESREPTGTISLGERAVAIQGNNQGSINTGVIINIHGDDIEKNRDVARTILAATLLAPPLEPKRKKAIASYYRAIAKTLVEAADALRQGVVPHGKCGEMLHYAHRLPAELGDFVLWCLDALRGFFLECMHHPDFGRDLHGVNNAIRVSFKRKCNLEHARPQPSHWLGDSSHFAIGGNREGHRTVQPRAGRKCIKILACRVDPENRADAGRHRGVSELSCHI